MHDSENCNLSALRNIFGFDTYMKKVCHYSRQNIDRKWKSSDCSL